MAASIMKQKSKRESNSVATIGVHLLRNGKWVIRKPVEREPSHTKQINNAIFAIAESLGIGIGTLYTHLKRVRRNHPEIYQTIMGIRKAQLAQRHEEALARADEHDHTWHRARRRARHRLW